MTDLLDLLPVPAERDLPPGRLELRAAALVAAVEAEASARTARRGRLRSWLTSLGLLIASSAAACSILLAGNVKLDRTLAAEAVLAGGSGLVVLAALPRPPRLAA